MAGSILAIRQQVTEEKLPVTPLEFHNSLCYWQQQFMFAYQKKDRLAQIYAVDEIKFLLKAKGNEEILQEMQTNCLLHIVGSSHEKRMHCDFLQLLSGSKEKFKACILQFHESYILILNSVNSGLTSIVDVFLECNADEIVRRSPFFLAEAAENQQFEVMKRLLTHQPPLLCIDQNGGEETALHNLCSFIEEELTYDDYIEWQTLIQQLVSRGCHPIQRDPMGLTSFHRAIKKRNSKFLDFLLHTYGPLPPQFMSELKESFLELVANQSEELIQDRYHEDEIEILNILLEYAPFLNNEFQLRYDLCWYPWILQALIDQIDEKNKTQQLECLFETLLHTPYVFISDLFSNYSEASSSSFFQSEIHHFMKIFDRQVHRLIDAGLNLNYGNYYSNTPLHLLMLSLKAVENRIFSELEGDKHLAKKLFSDCYSFYCRLIQSMITSENYKMENHLQQQPSDMAMLFRYQDIHAALLLVQLSSKRIREDNPHPAKRLCTTK